MLVVLKLDAKGIGIQTLSPFAVSFQVAWQVIVEIGINDFEHGTNRRLYVAQTIVCI